MKNANNSPLRYYGVMVSSTFTDLKAHRTALIKAMKGQGLTDVAMENDTAKPDADVIDSSRQMVRDAWSFVCLIGKKYGQTPVCPTRNPDRLSITELEFNEALRLERPILLFIMGDEHPLLAADVEITASKRKKLKAFQERAKEMKPGSKVHRIYSTFNSLEDFSVKAIHSVAGLRRYLEEEEKTVIPRIQICVSNMPYRRPRHFMGRSEALADIERALKHHPAIALVGMRGAGKSTVAVAYSDLHRTDYRAIWWIRAETEDGICTDLVALAVRLGWVHREEREDTPAVAVLDRLFGEGDRILLIYDNATNAELIYQYLPRGDSTHVLITSNARVWGNLVEPIDIVVWPNQVGADYLLARLSHNPATSGRAEAEALSEKLGGLPLALEVAAAYCDRKDIPLAKFHRLFDEKGLELFGPEVILSESHNRRTVTSAFALAIGEATKLHPAAERLIDHLALLAAEPIPIFLFEHGKASLGEPLASQLAGDGLDEALAALRAFALIDRENILDEINPKISTPSVRLHRLLREIAAKRCVGALRESTLAALIKAVVAVYPTDDHLDLLTNWPRARRLDALAYELVREGAPLPLGCEAEASELMEKVASYRHACTPAYAQVRSLLSRALGIHKCKGGQDSAGVAQILNKLGLLSLAEGDLPQARLLCEQALAMRQRVLDPNNSDIGHSHLNLARILLDQDDITSARAHGESALAIFEAGFGHVHADVAWSLSILGHIDESDLPLTQTRFEEAQRIYEKTVGPGHPAHATSLLNLAEVLERQDRLAGARQHIERALAIYQETMGPDSRQVAYGLSRLAKVLQAQGEAPRALSALQTVLAINEKWFGPEHAKCARLRERIDALTGQGANESTSKTAQ